MKILSSIMSSSIMGSQISSPFLRPHPPENPFRRSPSSSRWTSSWRFPPPSCQVLLWDGGPSNQGWPAHRYLVTLAIAHTGDCDKRFWGSSSQKMWPLSQILYCNFCNHVQMIFPQCDDVAIPTLIWTIFVKMRNGYDKYATRSNWPKKLAGYVW